VRGSDVQLSSVTAMALGSVPLALAGITALLLLGAWWRALLRDGEPPVTVEHRTRKGWWTSSHVSNSETDLVGRRSTSDCEGTDFKPFASADSPQVACSKIVAAADKDRWHPVSHADGERFWAHADTGELSWVRPGDASLLPPDESIWSRVEWWDGSVFWRHVSSNESVWLRPWDAEVQPPVAPRERFSAHIRPDGSVLWADEETGFRFWVDEETGFWVDEESGKSFWVDDKSERIFVQNR
jgi:hypothetical protein